MVVEVVVVDGNVKIALQLNERGKKRRDRGIIIINTKRDFALDFSPWADFENSIFNQSAN